MQSDPVLLKNHRKDPGSLLAGQIEALAGNRVIVTLDRERPWASITFAGTRHSLVVNWTSAADISVANNLAKILPEHEFAIPGYFIADLLVTEQTQTHLRVEALSIVDPIANGRA